MKKMKYSKIALAAIISVALLQGGTALAKKKGDLSVHEWGPWAVMARPAAGPQFAAYTPPPSQYTYHPHHPVPPPKPPVPKPVLAGLTTYSCLWTGDEARTNSPIIANFVMSIKPANDGVTEDIMASYTVSPPLVRMNDYPKIVSSWMPGTIKNNGGIFSNTNIDTIFTDHKITYTPFSAKVGEITSSIKGLVIHYKPWDLDMAVGGWTNAISVGKKYGHGYFAYGTTTNLATIDSLRAGNAKATYTGLTLVNQTLVKITIYFGNNNWSGSWGGGSDNNGTSISTDSLGVNHISGKMGFNATGTLSGSKLVVTSLTASDGHITGAVGNALFGNKAQMVGGVYQVTKTYTMGHLNGQKGTQSDITIAFSGSGT